MIGDQFQLQEEICGVVLSLKAYGECSLAFWNRNAENKQAISKIRQVVTQILNVYIFIYILLFFSLSFFCGVCVCFFFVFF